MSLICVQDSVRGIQWVKNYKFDFRFQQWGQCSVTFTCVAGHIVAQDFDERFKKWHSCQPAALFDAPIVSSIAEVYLPVMPDQGCIMQTDVVFRTRRSWQAILRHKPEVPQSSSSGLTATVRASTSAQRSVTLRTRSILVSKYTEHVSATSRERE